MCLHKSLIADATLDVIPMFRKWETLLESCGTHKKKTGHKMFGWGTYIVAKYRVCDRLVCAFFLINH